MKRQPIGANPVPILGQQVSLKSSPRDGGRGKNWPFLRDAGAGPRSAVLYTIIESCRCRGIGRDVLTQLPSMTNWQIKHVTPKFVFRKLPVLFGPTADPFETKNPFADETGIDRPSCPQ
jgi:hypothetical protein